MKDKNIGQDPFVEVNSKNVDDVIQILKDRLPKSANAYNMGLMSKTFPAEVKLFVYLNDISPNALILCITAREDFGNDMTISAPANPVITDEIKEAFLTTKAFDWNKAYIFSSLDKPISTVIFEIGSLIKNNGVSFLPHYDFYMARDDAVKLDVTLPPGFTNKPLNNISGIDFLTSTWKFTQDGTKEYVQRVTEVCPSSGIYETESDEPVAGILLNFNGFMGMLYSSKTHRGKGLAQLCIKSLVKQMAELGFIPTSSCEIKNIPSKAFHEKIGMKISNEVVDLIYDGSKW